MIFILQSHNWSNDDHDVVVVVVVNVEPVKRPTLGTRRMPQHRTSCNANQVASDIEFARSPEKHAFHSVHAFDLVAYYVPVEAGGGRPFTVMGCISAFDTARD